MSAETATVETLTAEVRTLVVGSRQVTLSVARQLDTVPVWEIEPFGRVNLSGPFDTIMVGRHRTSGALVISRPVHEHPDAEVRERYEAMPLIVLAGLR